MVTLTLSVNVCLTPEGLRQAEREVLAFAAELRSLQLAVASAGGENDDSPALASAKVLVAHLGPATVKLFATWARAFEPGSEHTLDEVAEAMDLDRETVKSYHRNSGRTLKKLALHHVWRSRWDGSRSIITMDEDVHRALRKLVT